MSVTGNPLLTRFYRYTMCRAGFSQNARRPSKGEGVTEVIGDADAGPGVPMYHLCCAPFVPKM